MNIILRVSIYLFLFFGLMNCSSIKNEKSCIPSLSEKEAYSSIYDHLICCDDRVSFYDLKQDHQDSLLGMYDSEFTWIDTLIIIPSKLSVIRSYSINGFNNILYLPQTCKFLVLDMDDNLLVQGDDVIDLDKMWEFLFKNQIQFESYSQIVNLYKSAFGFEKNDTITTLDEIIVHKKTYLNDEKYTQLKRQIDSLNIYLEVNTNENLSETLILEKELTEFLVLKINKKRMYNWKEVNIFSPYRRIEQLIIREKQRNLYY